MIFTPSVVCIQLTRSILVTHALLIQTRKTANWLCEKMTNDGHAVALLSGELGVEDRARVIASFREGKEKVLITTNVTARGEQY